MFDEIWVPTHFNLESFVKSGVSPDHIHVIHEPLDVNEIYNPRLVSEIDILSYFYPNSGRENRI
eukprot:TRINITY_DN8961_c0_g1_i1.p1 TRINITY_DN8961_c0_g1~~TRINITY_DN8961_c0_g1_i1.p1  ORF type:complete len:64 (-),score=7.47 TRINITY_DN8961_c0_g1_i1:119-310(-)